MRKLLAVASFLLTAGAAFARDGYEGRPLVCDMAPGPKLEQCQKWISTVQRPDVPRDSGYNYVCCAEADAYITDDFEIDANGNIVAIITADYPDGSPLHKGDKVVIPPEKINHAAEDVGYHAHGVVFYSGQTVLCYFAPPLT